MPDHMAAIRRVLGHKFDPEKSYSLVKHKELPDYAARGYRKVGEVPDAASGEQGTMIVVERPTDA